MRAGIPLRTALLLLAGGNAAPASAAAAAAFAPLSPQDRNGNAIFLCDQQQRLRGRFISSSLTAGRSGGGIHGNNPKLTTAMTPPPSTRPRRATALSVIRDPTDRSSSSSFGDSDSSDPSNSSSSEDPRTSVKSLLTQRSLTTLIYLLNTCNDAITSSWLELEFLDTSNQLEFHGTGAGYLERFGGWENVVLELMDCEVVKKRVSLGAKFRGGSGGGGGSGANSYLKDLEGGGSSSASASEASAASSASNGVPKKKNYSPFGSSPKSSSSTAADADAASSAKKESFGPFGSPSKTPSSSSSAAAAQGGGGGAIQRLGAGSSYLDSIAGASGSSIGSSSGSSSSSVDDISGKDDGADADTKESGAGGNGEAFQRALLTSRLGMENKAKDTTSLKVGDNKKDAEEALHRSLLAARLEAQTKSRQQQRQLHHQFEAARLKARQEENDRKILAREKQRAESNRRRLAEDRERSLREQEETNPNVRSDEDEYYVEIEIDPLSLAARLLAVREQIALEFVEDLTLIFKADEKLIADMLARSSRDGLKEHEDEDDDEDEDATTSLPDITINKDDDKKSSTISDSSSTSNDEEPYERTAVRMHQEKMAYLATGKSSSPFRKGNFDLLYNLCTQASVHRLLRQLMADECNLADGADCTATSSDKTKVRDYNEASFRWLRDFYVDRVSDYFDGDVRFGRADDFFEEWTRQPPALISDMSSAPSSSASNKGGLDYVQPMRLAEEMVRIRSDIVMEWRRSMRMVPEEDHGWLRLAMMEKRMANSDDSASGGGKDKGGISDNGGGLDDDFTDEFGLEGFQ